jgi:MFS family permease
MILETFAFATFAGFLIIVFDLGIIGTVVALVLFKCTVFLGLATGEISSSGKSSDQLSPVPRVRLRETNKTFLMYIIPWILFIVAIVLVDHIVWASLEQDPQIYNALHGPPYAYIGTMIFALVGGFMADRFGRKIPIIIGLAVLGFSIVLLNSIISPLTAFIHHMAIGIAFGFLIPIYSTIPGDLAEKSNAEKLYALTVVLPLLIYFGLGALPRYFGAITTATSVSWILTSLIFASIALVYLAKETLREEKVRERQTKEYLKKLIQVVEESKGAKE